MQLIVTVLSKVDVHKIDCTANNATIFTQEYM